MLSKITVCHVIVNWKVYVDREYFNVDFILSFLKTGFLYCYFLYDVILMCRKN